MPLAVVEDILGATQVVLHLGMELTPEARMRILHTREQLHRRPSHPIRQLGHPLELHHMAIKVAHQACQLTTPALAQAAAPPQVRFG